MTLNLEQMIIFKKEKPSDNIIFKNLHVSVGEVEDMMAIAVYGSKNIWIDHCTFESSHFLYIMMRLVNIYG